MGVSPRFNPLRPSGAITVKKKILKFMQIEDWTRPNLPVSSKPEKKLVTRPF